METIVLNVILVLFPILIYLVFSCYNILSEKQVEKIIFIITMCTSLYFSLTFNVYLHSVNLLLLFCNIPVIICYLKKECEFGIILSLVVILFSYLRYDENVYIVCIKYLLYFLVYVILVKKKNFNYLFFKIVAIIQGFFISFEYFIYGGGKINQIFLLFLYASIIYIITFFSLYLFKLADNITSMYCNINKMEQECKLRDSLFKLTHEIKNPIAVCKGYLDMINLMDNDKSQKYINIIRTEIDRSLNVMSDFMDYSKIKINKEIIDMGLLMDEVYESFNILANSKKIKIVYDNKYDEIYIWGDYDRLKQVFVNLIKNSIESIESDGIIKISINLIDKHVNVLIEDNGNGMDDETLRNVKEMFYTTKRGGTGLGVALSNEIILAHSGMLDYESAINEGTTCIVSLPI